MKFSKNMMLVAVLVSAQAVTLFGIPPRSTATTRPSAPVVKTAPIVEVKPADLAVKSNQQNEQSVRLAEQLKVQRINYLFDMINNYFKLPYYSRTDEIKVKIQQNYKFVGELLEEEFNIDKSLSSDRSIVPYVGSGSGAIVPYVDSGSQETINRDQGNSVDDSSLASLSGNIKSLSQYLLAENNTVKQRDDFKNGVLEWVSNISNLLERVNSSLTDEQKSNLVQLTQDVTGEFYAQYGSKMSQIQKQLLNQQSSGVVIKIKG